MDLKRKDKIIAIVLLVFVIFLVILRFKINNSSVIKSENRNGKAMLDIAKIIENINDDNIGKLSYPLSFFQFGEDIYLDDAVSQYKKYWGKKLVSINGYSIKELKEKLKPFIAKENKNIRKNQLLVLLKFVEPLKFSKITNENNAIFTFEGSPNESINVQPFFVEEYTDEKMLSNNEELKNKVSILNEADSKIIHLRI